MNTNLEPIAVALGVFLKNDIPVVSSRDVACVFRKQHTHVLDAIRRLDCSEEFNQSNFRLVKYKDEKGEMRPEYLLTRDGFTFLGMGFTGKKAAAFKEAYINRFNEMERQLKERAISMVVRRTLTDSIRDSDLNVKLKGWAYKTVTDLVYKVTVGCSARQYRKAHGLPDDSNVRDHVDTYTLSRISQAEKLVQALTEAGADYEHLKRVLGMTFHGPVLAEAAS